MWLGGNGVNKLKQLYYVSVGNGVKSVGDWAFSSCFSLDHFSFGAGLEKIGKEAFSDCNNVTTIVSTRSVPPVCGDQALADISMFDCTVHVPSMAGEYLTPAGQEDGSRHSGRAVLCPAR